MRRPVFVFVFDATLGSPGERPGEAVLNIGTLNPTGLRGKAERLRHAWDHAARDQPWAVAVQEHHLLPADAAVEVGCWRHLGGTALLGPVVGRLGGDRRRVSGGVGVLGSFLGIAV